MLTPVQWWVLRFRAAGLSVDETAMYLGMSRKAVQRHSSAAFGRLGVVTLVEAMDALGWVRFPARPPVRATGPGILRR